MRKNASSESIALNTLKQGAHFYTDKADKDITAIACYYNVRVKTERLIIINHITLDTDRITKVTIL
jgi:hypothetical protein